jgi:hypothetical protein
MPRIGKIKKYNNAVIRMHPIMSKITPAFTISEISK